MVIGWLLLWLVISIWFLILCRVLVMCSSSGWNLLCMLVLVLVNSLLLWMVIIEWLMVFFIVICWVLMLLVRKCVRCGCLIICGCIVGWLMVCIGILLMVWMCLNIGLVLVVSFICRLNSKVSSKVRLMVILIYGGRYCERWLCIMLRLC